MKKYKNKRHFKKNIDKHFHCINLWKTTIRILFFVVILIILFKSYMKNKEDKSDCRLSLEQKLNDYETKNFSIIRRLECPPCGFFSYYLVYVGCIQKIFIRGEYSHC